LAKTALVVASALLVGCGRPTSTTTVAPTLLSPPGAFQCVMNTMKTLGFQRTMYDQDELRTSGRKENPKITFSNTQFRKAWDRLDVKVQAADSGSAMDVTAITEAEYFSQNGKNFEPLKPSAEVRQAAEQLQTRCEHPQPATKDSVPTVTAQ
jgi:hypothetical protein